MSCIVMLVAQDEYLLYPLTKHFQILFDVIAIKLT